MPPWANGKNGKEYRADDGPQADRRHLQRRRRGAVPLERLGPERGGDPHLGRRRRRQRPAALVHQVLRRAPRPTLAAASSRTSTAGITASRSTCATRRRSPASAWSTRSRRPGSTAARRQGMKVEDHVLGWYQALDRGAHPLRDGPRPAARRRPRGPVQDARSCPTSPPCRTSSAGSSARSSTAAAASWRPTRRRSTTSGEPGARTSAWPTSSASRSGASRRGPMQNSYLRLEDDPAHRPPPSDPRRPGGRAADHQRGVPARSRRRTAPSATRR